jgi:YidC/Oxa1 family membrane protein insertase
MKLSAWLRPHWANMRAFRAALQDAEKSNSSIERQKVAFGLEEYYEKHGIRNIFFFTRLEKLIQILVRSYLFIAVAKLCNIEQLTHSGFGLLPDLTIVDSTYVLPVLLAALVDSRLRVNTRSSCQPNPIPR